MTTVTDRQVSGGDWKVYISEQTDKGAINATPEFTPVRRVSGRAKRTVNYTESAEVSLDFNGAKQIQENTDLAMELEAETTKQSIGFLIAAIYGAESVVTVTATDIAATASGFTSVALGFTNIAVGDFIFVSGFTDTTINTIYRVTAKADNGTLTTYPVPAATEVAGDSVTVSTSKTYNANDSTYYTVQNRVIDESAAGDIDYETFYDGIAGQYVMNIAETGILTSTLSMVFEKVLNSSSAVAGQTDAAETTDAPLSAVQSVEGFEFDGVNSTCVTKSLQLTVNLNQQSDDAAGCTKQYSRGAPQFTISGASRSTTADSMAIRDSYRNAERVQHAVKLDHGNGEHTIISLPQIVLTEWDMPDSNNTVAVNEYSGAAEKSSYGYTLAVFRNWS